MHTLHIRYVGGPTALLELGGLRLLTDPTFDPPGEYPIGSRKLVKTMAPALAPDQLGTVDAVLLSHDQHPDNLDHAGRLGPVDVAVLFVGAAQTALLGDAYLTLTSALAVEAAQILGARQVVALHFEGWAHFTEGRAALLEAFQRAGLAARLHLPEADEPLEV